VEVLIEFNKEKTVQGDRKRMCNISYALEITFPDIRIFISVLVFLRINCASAALLLRRANQASTRAGAFFRSLIKKAEDDKTQTRNARGERDLQCDVRAKATCKNV
jgi:hypothetical protein